MPSPTASPVADAIETIFDAHTITGTFENSYPARSGVSCACGTKHPFGGGGVFPSHDEHLAALIDDHFATGQRDAIVRVMETHAIARSFTQHLPAHREVDQCCCGTQHPPSWDPRWATHRRHLAEQIAEVLAAHVEAQPAKR